MVAVTIPFGLARVADAAGPAPAVTIVSNGWTTSAWAPAVAAGSTVTVRARVASSTTRDGLVDVEIYGPTGQVRQQWFDNQSFSAGATQTLAVSWDVPADQPLGTYTVKIGVFGTGWSGLQQWNDAAGTFAVTAPGAPTSQVTTTTVRPTTTTTVRPTTTTAAPTTTAPPTTTVTPGQRFATLPVGAQLPSDAQCAALVRRTPEVRPANATANQTRGANLSQQSGLYARVTGNFTGTTDEIIQWASCKWGIDEDIVRAQVAKESWWYQSATGDWTGDPTHCATGHTLGSDGRPGQCPESVGLLQVRFPYFGAAFPSASYSSAYNLDEALAARRNCFEGNEQWLNTVERGRTYAAGDLWGCIGTWFSGRWYTSASNEYMYSVQNWYNQRIWESPNFRAG
jgi:autotransporter family porin